MPPSAASKLPLRRLTAPVNAPRSWPNSSDSSSVSGSAAHDTGTNGPFRVLSAWIARASTSLPVPLSPRIRTVEARLRRGARELQRLLHRRARAGDVVELEPLAERLAQHRVLAHHLLLRHDLLHQQAQLLRVERLDDVVVGAELHRLDRRLDGGERRDHHDRHARAGACVRPRAPRGRPCRASSGRPAGSTTGPAPGAGAPSGPSLARLDGIAVGGEPVGQRLAHDLLVVNDQDAGGGQHVHCSSSS